MTAFSNRTSCLILLASFVRSFVRSIVRSLTIWVVALPCDLVNVLSVERVGAVEHVSDSNIIETSSIDGDTLRGPNSDILVEDRSGGESAGEGRDGGGVPTAPSAKL